LEADYAKIVVAGGRSFGFRYMRFWAAPKSGHYATYAASVRLA